MMIKPVKIHQFDLHGKKLKTFFSIGETAKELKLPKHSIEKNSKNKDIINNCTILSRNKELGNELVRLNRTKKKKIRLQNDNENLLFNNVGLAVKFLLPTTNIGKYRLTNELNKAALKNKLLFNYKVTRE